MKIPPTISKLLTNKYVLYLVGFLALTNVIGYMMMGKIDIAILFVLIGYIMTFFSKNMVIVLLVPLIVVSLIVSGRVVKEGLENASSSSDSTPAVPVTVPAVPAAPKKKESEEVAGNTDNFEVGRKKGSRVDYGSTIEKAYDNLNDVLGSEGITRLTNDTQKLMKQQLQLAEAMKGMSPMLKEAQSMLKSLNLNEIGDLGAIVKQLGVDGSK